MLSGENYLCMVSGSTVLPDLGHLHHSGITPADTPDF
jgi:hypothetical protein